MCQSIRTLVLPVALMVGLSGCATTDANDGSLVITYARNSRSVMPIYEVRIFNDRSAIYEGKANVKTLGTREFRLTESQYQRLLTVFREADFRNMDSTYGSEILGERDLLISAKLEGPSEAKTVVASSFPLGWTKRLITLMWSVEDALGLEEFVCPAAVVVVRGESVETCKLRREIEEKVHAGSK